MLGLLLLEVLMVLGPVLGVRAGVTEQSCVFISGERMMEVRARDGWLYTILFPSRGEPKLLKPKVIILKMETEKVN